MIKKSLLLLLIIILIFLVSCKGETYEVPSMEPGRSDEIAPLGYDFIIFDSDGDGVKDDIVEHKCLDVAGGYGSFQLEIFISGNRSYLKVFDSTYYTLDEQIYKKLSENINGELMIDTIYSVVAVDVDSDGCDELVCRQYAWVESHSNHMGDVVLILNVTDVVEIMEARFEVEVE